MPNRVMYKGDTAPPVRLHFTADGVVMDLSAASAMVVHFLGQTATFSGTLRPISPAQTDPSGVVYNSEYDLAANDTSVIDIYRIFVVITWSTGSPNQIQSVESTDTLQVIAVPVVGGTT